MTGRPVVTQDGGRNMAGSNLFDLPSSVDEITPEWMTAALSRKYPGITVHGLEIHDVVHGACTKVRIALETSRADFPQTVLMKAGFEKHSPHMRRMHQKEHQCYHDLVPTWGIQTAVCHFSDEMEDGRALVILEDLCLRDVSFQSLQAPLDFPMAQRFLSDLARIHARWWDAPDINRNFPWINLSDHSQMGHYLNILANAAEFDSYVASPRGAAMPRKLLDRHMLVRAFDAMEKIHRRMPQTILHGDAHLGNLFIDQQGNPGFLDYQSCVGPWCIDVSYFLIAGLDMVDRQRWQGALLHHYLEALVAHGVTAPPAFDEAWLAYRQSVVWGLLIWLMNSSQFQTETNNTAAATRFAMAMVDLDTLATLCIA